jgi:hypothetical protein
VACAKRSGYRLASPVRTNLYIPPLTQLDFHAHAPTNAAAFDKIQSAAIHPTPGDLYINIRFFHADTTVENSTLAMRLRLASINERGRVGYHKLHIPACSAWVADDIGAATTYGYCINEADCTWLKHAVPQGYHGGTFVLHFQLPDRHTPHFFPRKQPAHPSWSALPGQTSPLNVLTLIGKGVCNLLTEQLD